MSYIQIGLYLLVALLVNAFMRASYVKNGTKSWVYRYDLVYAENYSMINVISLWWFIAVPSIIFIRIIITIVLPLLGAITSKVVTPVTNIFLYLMDDSRKSAKLQNKKKITLLPLFEYNGVVWTSLTTKKHHQTLGGTLFQSLDTFT